MGRQEITLEWSEPTLEASYQRIAHTRRDQERRALSPYQRRKKMVHKRRRWGMVLLALIVAYVLLLAAAPASQGQSSDESDAAQTSPDGSSATGVTPRSPEASRMLQKAEREGSIRAIVGLRTDFVPEGRLNRAEETAQQNGIENAGRRLREELAGT